MLAVIRIAAGTFHTITVKQDGSVWSTGVNTDATHNSFVQVIPRSATAAAVGKYFGIALTQHSYVWATGNNNNNSSTL